MSDEESDGLLPPANAPKSQALQHQLRSVRVMSAASVFLGLASVVMMASVVLRPASPQVAASAPALVGLSSVPTGHQAEEHEMRGWYRTYLDAQVRAEESVDSEAVDTLSAGSLVYVAEAHGRRARILKPVKGWMSLQTAEGITILRPDMTYQASPNKTDIQAVFRSREVREANKRLQESAMRLTAVEKQLMETLKKMKKIPKHVEQQLVNKWPQLADAPKAGARLAGQAKQQLHKIVKPEGAKNLLRHVKGNQHVQRLMNSDKVKDLVETAQSKGKSIQETQHAMKEFKSTVAV